MFNIKNLKKLQKEIKKTGLKGYLILNNDPHMSEYKASYYSYERLYYCPFKGDTGQLLVTEDNAYLFVDGRFFIQAENELKGTNITLMKVGEKGVLPIQDFIKTNKISPIGVNESLISASMYNDLLKEISIIDTDFSSLLENRPSLPKDKVRMLDDSLFSLTTKEKIQKIKEKIKEQGCEANLITTLDDIAYILHIRGNDIENNPVFYSYLYISLNEGVHLFIDKKKIDFEIDGVIVHEYDEISNFLKKKSDVKTLLMPDKVNAKLYNILKNKVNGFNPSYLLKAIKGEEEIKNTKRIQALDGLALIKFMMFLKEHINDYLNEYEYAEVLKKFRLENKDCFDTSFDTICAVNENSALMHYTPTKDKSTIVTKNDLNLLVDSGGQYYGGTSDTTRTFPLKEELTSEFIHDYTLTLKSVIALSSTVFLKGCSGQSLDIKAREIMWKEGMDYKCGTGHGVGYILNVHEGPNSFRYNVLKGKTLSEEDVLVPGMITTVEPGVYKENKYGIRIENNLLTIPAFTTNDGEFFKFETITYVPIDTRALDLSIMSEEEIKWLNDYHKLVYKKISEVTNDKEILSFLKEITKEIHK